MIKKSPITTQFVLTLLLPFVAQATQQKGEEILQELRQELKTTQQELKIYKEKINKLQFKSNERELAHAKEIEKLKQKISNLEINLLDIKLEYKNKLHQMEKKHREETIEYEKKMKKYREEKRVHSSIMSAQEQNVPSKKNSYSWRRVLRDGGTFLSSTMALIQIYNFFSGNGELPGIDFVYEDDFFDFD